MSNTSKAVTAREAAIASRIIAIREENVILDVHIAEFYGIETRTLKQAVRRNRDRFPDDFLYELTGDEINSVVSQNVIPSKRHFGGAVPFAFTENGVAMLSSILNIAIMRTFTMLRKALLLQKDIMSEMGNVKRKLIEHDEKILVIFEYLKQVEKSGQQQLDQSNRKRIGYIRSDE